jgi:hypothetical protein
VGAAGNAGAKPSALVVFLPARAGVATEAELQSIPDLSLAILSSRQGDYDWRQMEGDLAAAAHRADPAGSQGGRLRIERLPGHTAGLSRLRALVANRPAGELVLFLEQGRTRDGHELLWLATGGLGPGGQTLTSPTTEQRGLIGVVDVVPTLLAHLHLSVPAGTHGRPIRTDGPLGGSWLRSLKARLEVVYPRRLPALAWLLAACALLVIIARVTGTGMRRAIRVDALALLFAPTAMLLPATLESSAGSEYALIALFSLALGALADALLRWPRASLAPTLAAVAAFTADALAHTQLLIRSLLGPNPAYGSRFYGIGNELKSALAVLVLCAVAAALYRTTRSRRAAATMGCAGAGLALLEGSARIGAGVGGVVLVCAGTAVASALLLPGRLRRGWVLAAALATPLLGLAALAGLDLATAHGAGHFTGSVLDAGSLSELDKLIARRYQAAWEELGNGLMPLASALAAALAVLGVRHRERLLAPVASDPGWLAALAGGLTAGVVGTLSEDSGPLLLVSAVAALGCVLLYLHAAPTQRGGDALTPRSPDTRHAERSRARRPVAARAR